MMFAFLVIFVYKSFAHKHRVYVDNTQPQESTKDDRKHFMYSMQKSSFAEELIEVTKNCKSFSQSKI